MRVLLNKPIYCMMSQKLGLNKTGDWKVQWWHKSMKKNEKMEKTDQEKREQGIKKKNNGFCTKKIPPFKEHRWGLQQQEKWGRYSEEDGNRVIEQ